MTGPEHYARAEQALFQADMVMDADYGMYASMETAERLQRRACFAAEAQVHAMLALAWTHGCAPQVPEQLEQAPLPGRMGTGNVNDDDDESLAFADEADDYDPGPEVDDEGGMSEYRHMAPDDPF